MAWYQEKKKLKGCVFYSQRTVLLTVACTSPRVCPKTPKIE